MKSAAAIVLGLAATACSHDIDMEGKSQQQASLDNAQETLGFYIPENQDWVMSSMISANLPITGTESETYTVKVYSNNPLVDNIGYILAQKEVKSGENFVCDFRTPSYLTSYVIGITNSIGRTTYEIASLVNGQLTSFAATRATRSNPGENYPATHEYQLNGVVTGGVNANFNEWADPNKKYGGWLVPDPLTEKQKLRVKLYFQTHPNLTYEDPHLRHFFVQQVYKGGTAKYGASNENIIAADNNEYNSDNMNHLTVGQNNMHINNFNAGDATELEVLKNGEAVGGATQKDKIELMVNIDDTSCFGYHDSGSSNVSSNNPNHNDKAALVAASVIDEWANSAEAKALGIDLGEPVVDKWNRSFLGFDLAIKEGTQAYAKDGNGDVLLADYSQAPGQPKYAWDGQKVIPMTEAGVLLDKFKHILKGTDAIGWLDTNSNFYVSADKVTLGQTSASLNGATIGSQNWNDLKDYVVFDDAYVDAQNPKAKVLNLKRIMDLVNDDYLPINNKNLQEWVKVGKSDGYFSDWIVTLTKAERKIKEEKNIWTYAFEDSNRKSDYDMNDVVIKVQESLDGNTLTFKLVAAGCEYSNEVYFNGTVVTWNNGTTEVHDALGVGKGVLTNTKSRTGVDGMSPATATFPKPAGFDYQTADIKIMPSGGDVASRADGGDGFVHLAETGKQPTGIVIPYDWAWPTERKCIVNCYNETGHSFASWAAQENVDLRTVSADWFKYPTADTTK